MRELVYYVASTLDGYIAHADGSFEGFAWDVEFVADLRRLYPETFPVHMREGPLTKLENCCFDAVIMGRNTYEVGLQEGITNPYDTLDQYVVTQSLKKSPHPQVQLIKDEVVETVKSLKNEPGKAIWLCGGGKLAGSLLDAQMIDRLILKLNPVLFGSGIPLFSGAPEQMNLELMDHQHYNSGHLLLNYRIKPPNN